MKIHKTQHSIVRKWFANPIRIAIAVSCLLGLTTHGTMNALPTNQQSSLQDVAIPDPASYDIEEIPSLPGDLSIAYGINSAGQVAGFSMNGQGCCAQAFRFTPPSQIEFLQPPPPINYGFITYGHAINEAGIIAGEIDITGGGGGYQAFLSSGPSSVTPLGLRTGTLPGYIYSQGLAINKWNEVAGDAYSGVTARRAILFFNSNGNKNSFFGESAGIGNTTGHRNTFVGDIAGYTNTTGSDNTLIGSGAYVSLGNLSFATAIGANAYVSQSYSLVLGQPGTNVGIGTAAPAARLHVASGSFCLGPYCDNSGARLIVGGNDGEITFLDRAATSVILNPSAGERWVWYGSGGRARLWSGGDKMSVDPAGNVGISGNLDVGRYLTVSSYATGNIALCFQFTGQVIVPLLSICSSSLRYKKDVARFVGGLDIIKRLRPISFTWKQDGVRDIGLGAEDVARVEPLLTFTNGKGEVEGVKYSQLSAVFVNAFKEQQAQIQKQQKQIERQQDQIRQEQAQLARQQHEVEALKNLVCRAHPKAAVCK